MTLAFSTTSSDVLILLPVLYFATILNIRHTFGRDNSNKRNVTIIKACPEKFMVPLDRVFYCTRWARAKTKLEWAAKLLTFKDKYVSKIQHVIKDRQLTTGQILGVSVFAQYFCVLTIISQFKTSFFSEETKTTDISDTISSSSFTNFFKLS